ncbi:hypothetical protein GpartN1_g430.t1 [Galdieria partita]|uniref:Uncharacterized protein n=1 Tax=Galdieria partita TaxID=83374 RepID=A0A9C7PQE2_9RHOD|nr:hypothetical protein GpartN1_g430.t1 [Galdieria partita]
MTGSGAEGYAVDSRAQLAEQLYKSEKEYKSLLSYLASQRIGKNTTQRAFLPLGPLAYASGTLKPCEEVLVLLGENYFARVTLEQAVNIAHRRIAFIEKRLSDLKVDTVTSEMNEPDIDKQENEILLDRWNKSMHLLEQYMQVEDVVNLCEEYDDSISKEPVRVHGLKQDMSNRIVEKDVEEIVDWNSLLDVSGLMTEADRQNQELPDSIWNDLRQLELAEASSFVGEVVEDSVSAISGALPSISQNNRAQDSCQYEENQFAANYTASSVSSNIAKEPQSTTSQRNFSRKTFFGQIKERKSLSS